MKVVVDFNILFSALLKSPNKFSEAIFLSGHDFYTPAFAVSEFIKNKGKLAKVSKLSDNHLLEMFMMLTKDIHIFDENMISKENLYKAYTLCKDIDIKDMVYVALALETEALLWTGDKELKSGLKQKGFDGFFEV